MLTCHRLSPQFGFVARENTLYSPRTKGQMNSRHILLLAQVHIPNPAPQDSMPIPKKRVCFYLDRPAFLFTAHFRGNFCREAGIVQ
jgi:hypothetical protein